MQAFCPMVVLILFFIYQCPSDRFEFMEGSVSFFLFCAFCASMTHLTWYLLPSPAQRRRSRKIFDESIWSFHFPLSNLYESLISPSWSFSLVFDFLSIRNALCIIFVPTCIWIEVESRRVYKFTKYNFFTHLLLYYTNLIDL